MNGFARRLYGFGTRKRQLGYLLGYLLGNYYQIEVKQSRITGIFTTEDADEVTITQNGISFRVEQLNERGKLRDLRSRSGVMKVAKDVFDSLGITLRVRIGNDWDGTNWDG